jgi:hypothetical protein
MDADDLVVPFDVSCGPKKSSPHHKHPEERRRNGAPPLKIERRGQNLTVSPA